MELRAAPLPIWPNCQGDRYGPCMQIRSVDRPVNGALLLFTRVLKKGDFRANVDTCAAGDERASLKCSAPLSHK
ncbi:unnamed protein product [marine sediment metagenome]|uniref:Uncharacterized protein n=1 Tax=marine sediment metagenome TaxID=412755 RepID=X0Y9X4_9ZZZZ